MRPRAVTASVLLAVTALFGATACSGPAVEHHASASDSYGALPSFLPSDAVVPDSVLTGSTRNPAVTSQGDQVRVRSGSATVLAEVTGPEVPGQGLPYETPSTTCTWTITLDVEKGTLPVSAAQFNALDHLGAVYPVHPVAGQPAPPTSLSAGQHATFEVRAVMPTGEGLMRWAPDEQRIVSSWDFEVETD